MLFGAVADRKGDTPKQAGYANTPGSVILNHYQKLIDRTDHPRFPKQAWAHVALSGQPWKALGDLLRHKLQPTGVTTPKAWTLYYGDTVKQAMSELHAARKKAAETNAANAQTPLITPKPVRAHEVARKLAAKWNQMTPSQKRPWLRRQEFERKRTEARMRDRTKAHKTLLHKRAEHSEDLAEALRKRRKADELPPLPSLKCPIASCGRPGWDVAVGLTFR